MKKLLKTLGIVVLLLLLGAGAFYLWANSASKSRLAQSFETHRVEIPVPFPLSKAELETLRKERIEAFHKKRAESGQDAGVAPADPLADVDLKALALKRALARGKHLVEARYGCIECHGDDFGGGTMMDAMPVAQLFGPNLTQGTGSKVKAYKVSDWDRIIRHGVLPGGKPAAMPSEDYFGMSDQELSDIIAYIQSRPAVNRPSKERVLGPIGKVLMGLGKLRLSAEQLNDHKAKHPSMPPPAKANVAFGKHLIQVCTGCHRPNLSGGPIVGGDPKWPPASNLTMHEQGLAGWTYQDFVSALRSGKSKKGTELRVPMSALTRYAKKMTDTELRAMWLFIQSAPKVPTSPQ